MDYDVEARLLQEIDALKRKVQLLEGREETPLPTYQYSRIRDRDLKQLFQIEQVLAEQRFDAWFQHPVQVDEATITFLSELLEDNTALIERYSEEDLKINFIAPLLKRVRFKSFEKKIREYYELPMTYATEYFVLNGTVDFVVSEGLLESKKPYFFIQEFKRSEEHGNPRPQLLAELISAVELNGWQEIKGAYIIGASWHFVVLKKLADSTYQYALSPNFDSTKLDDLCAIYKHLVTVKDEVFGMIT